MGGAVLKRLTVFTPVYNRADMLPRLYESLLSQTDRDFLWLAVDDGSKDNSLEVLKGFEAEGKLEIRIISRENGGKMRAHNTGVKAAETELFVCLDSDDCFTKNAVSDILKRWDEVSGKGNIAGIVANKGETEDKPLYGCHLPDVTEDTLSGLYRKGFKGETTLIYRTEVLKKHLFPEIDGEKYIPEDVVYDEIDREYKLSVMDKVLTVCILTENGLTDRAKELREQNPNGWYIYYVSKIGITGPSILKLKYLSHYLRFRPLAAPEVREKYSVPFIGTIPAVPGAVILALMGKR